MNPSSLKKHSRRFRGTIAIAAETLECRICMSSVTLSAFTTTSLVPNVTAVVRGDFNGDGQADLVVSGDGGTYLLLASTNSTFASAVLLGTGPLLSHPAADLNGDGKLDLVLFDNADPTSPKSGVLLGNGDGTFTSISGPAATSAVGDVNN